MIFMLTFCKKHNAGVFDDKAQRLGNWRLLYYCSTTQYRSESPANPIVSQNIV